MSLEKVGQIKDSKPFRIADIAVYAVILAVTVTLLIVFVFARDNTSLKASGAVAQISSNDGVMFEFDFGSGGYKIIADEQRLEISDGETLTVKVFTENGSGYNEIVFDMSDGGSVTAKSANCSLRHDCTYMSISRAGDSIVCIPHHLTVSVKSAISPPSTGHVKGRG